MALNTQPLTPARRVVMLAVLLGCFIGSLGLASTLVRWRSQEVQKDESGRGGVGGAAGVGPVISFSIDWPAGFTADVDGTAPEIKAARRGKLPGVPGMRYVFVLLQPASVDVQEVTTLEELADEIYQQRLHAAPETGRGTTMGGVTAVEVAGSLNQGKGFARLRLTVVAGRPVGVFYIGESAFAKVDQAVWTRMTGSFKFRAGGGQ